ncbi:MAG: HAMP domain-containing sensor histidine kinase [Cyclobacteriaceae bacterium]|nr:HAMP domain-containing sensor histidine kinase [Cyclobacteriaceae bacterium]
MSRLTLRIVIGLAALSIVGITATQIYWVRKAFDLKENQFNADVNLALENVATRIYDINKTPMPGNSLVDQESSNYFTVFINGPIDSNLLGFLLKNEFDKRKITADYQFGVFDCSEQCIPRGNYISPTKNKIPIKLSELPALKRDRYYFGVRFPQIEANLISQMGIWGFSSVVMLVVIFFFVYTLFVIFKQRRLSEVQNDFINNMTHEFKTPLATIAISSEVLKDPSITKNPERLLNYATIIENESQRLKQQVERVLQMAQTGKTDVGLKKEQQDIHDLIKEAVGNHAVALASKRGEVQLEWNANSSRILVDKLHFTNVIGNLLDNAIKYCEKEPKIAITTSSNEASIQIEISDNGIGISSENQKKIFARFFRVPTGNLHDIKGFGLGLNYVKLIVEAHKGRISVQSKPGSGSIFRIVLQK